MKHDRSIGPLARASLAACISTLAGCVESPGLDPEPSLDTSTQAVVWAGGTQPALKGAYWLKYDGNYGTVSINDNRRVAWNLETPAFGGFEAAAVASLYTSYMIKTLVRIGDSAKPSPAEVSALNGTGFSCSQINTWMAALDQEANAVDGAISASPSSIGGFIFGNEPNIPAPTEWGLSGTAYKRAYKCYFTRWNSGAKSGYPLLVAGPGGCGLGFDCTGFYNGLLNNLGPTDGFTIHAYGEGSAFVTGTDTGGFQAQADRINTSKPGSPIYITEFAVGGNQSPSTGWADYFNQRFNDVRTYNQTHGGQIKALIYFVDTLLGTRRGSCAGMTGDQWYLTSLCDPAIRGAWLDSAAARVSAPARGNQADIVEGLSTIPPFLMPGQVSTVSFLTRNPGLTTWPGTGVSSSYRLGANTGNGFTFSAFPQCGGYSLGALNARIFTCSQVAPGGSNTYVLDARAPTNNPTSATLSVKMVQEQIEWFGYGARFPVGLGISSCGTALTQCILFNRPDLLPYYAGNGWTTTCPYRDSIVSNWCTIDPTGCNELKTGACSAFNNSCRCGGGTHLGGTAIDPNATFCGYRVCGQDNKIYSCQAGSPGTWVNTQVICN